MVVACLALFVALGGTSYGLATGSIDSREIKNGSVRGKDIARDTVAGVDVAEQTLGEVPLARDAGTLDGRDSSAFLGVAAKAADANSVDGLDSSAFVQGPLVASVGADTNESLEPDPNVFFTGTTFQNPAPRRYAVWATKTLSYSCSVGPCTADLGLYANGTPLPGTGRTFTDAAGGEGVTQQLVMLGVTDVLPAGQVKLQIARSDSTGTASWNASKPGQVMAVALDG
jgi:hypothetical protein